MKQSISLQDQIVAYREKGEGRPCLVLHGGPGLSGEAIGPWFPDAGGALRTITVDLPGHGDSSGGGASALSLEAMADTVAALADALKLERPILCGWSMGGAVALHGALRHPERIGGLLLVSAAAKYDLEGVGPRAVAAGATQEQLALFGDTNVPDAAAMERFWKTILPLYLHPDKRHLGEELLAGVRFRPDGVLPLTEAVICYDVRPRLGEIRTPALVIGGEADFMIPPNLCRELADGLPNGRFVEIAGAGHFPFAEQPAAFEQAVQAWLAEQRLTKTP